MQWCKTSYGVDGPTGNHFVENILTVVATCHQQSVMYSTTLTRCFTRCMQAFSLPIAPTTSPLASNTSAIRQMNRYRVHQPQFAGLLRTRQDRQINYATCIRSIEAGKNLLRNDIVKTYQTE